jgi:hypothetical protein
MKIKESLSLEAMEAEFLKTEWYKDFYNPMREKYNAIVTAPDLSSSVHSQVIKSLLWQWRSPVLSRIPKDIKWYLSELEGNDFGDLLIMRELSWYETFGNAKKLKDVAKSIFSGKIQSKGVNFEKIKAIKENIGTHNFHEKIIVISSNPQGPYSILEGNHRAVAFQLKVEESGDKSHLPKEVIVGESPDMGSSPWLNS